MATEKTISTGGSVSPLAQASNQERLALKLLLNEEAEQHVALEASYELAELLPAIIRSLPLAPPNDPSGSYLLRGLALRAQALNNIMMEVLADSGIDEAAEAEVLGEDAAEQRRAKRAEVAHG